MPAAWPPGRAAAAALRLAPFAMGGQERYPRQAARTLRQADRARAAAVFVRAGEALRTTEAALVRARAALAEHAARVPGAPRGKGGGSAGLRREAAYARAHSESARRLRSEVQSATRAVERDRRALEAARSLVTRADGAERVMDRDLTRFEDATRKRRDRLEEEDADEVAAARRQRR